MPCGDVPWPISPWLTASTNNRYPTIEFVVSGAYTAIPDTITATVTENQHRMRHISTRTVDASGNINTIGQDTVTTLPAPTKPPPHRCHRRHPRTHTVRMRTCTPQAQAWTPMWLRIKTGTMAIQSLLMSPFREGPYPRMVCGSGARLARLACDW